jgi:hypothetical protein
MDLAASLIGTVLLKRRCSCPGLAEIVYRDLLYVINLPLNAGLRRFNIVCLLEGQK